MRCPRCNTVMKNTMHFEKEKQYGYNVCPKCHTESRPKRLHLEEYDKEKTKYSDNSDNSKMNNQKELATKSKNNQDKQTKHKFNPPIKQSKHKTNTIGKTQKKHNRQKH